MRTRSPPRGPSSGTARAGPAALCTNASRRARLKCRAAPRARPQVSTWAPTSLRPLRPVQTHGKGLLSLMLSQFRRRRRDGHSTRGGLRDNRSASHRRNPRRSAACVRRPVMARPQRAVCGWKPCGLHQQRHPGQAKIRRLHPLRRLRRPLHRRHPTHRRRCARRPEQWLQRCRHTPSEPAYPKPIGGRSRTTHRRRFGSGACAEQTAE